ncbi:general secretion pathway protein L [Natronospira proteinivora]|uniref:Type II secretion system protein L n=1 Tax=Natronospira proteinivora TaxID=1807133 RepID=A0ABT1G6G3_9GAMM|nr:type II secretion system protein GspL [Natronospira proteinivora]MCP1726876.1 general secretion pathway protein L [Natronospira proteinivora]
MSETLVIHFQDPTQPVVDWYILDNQGQRLGAAGHGLLQDCASEAVERRIVALMPGERVSLMDAQIPTRKRQRILQAAPWVLEERLAQDVSSLHFALGPRQPDDQVRIAVVGRSDMQAMLEQLESADLKADAIVPDFLVLPWQSGEWVLAVGRDRVMVRTANCQGFSIDRTIALEMLEFLFQDEEQTAPERLILLRPENDPDFPQALETHLGASIEVDDRPYQEALSQALVPQLERRPVLDLAEGEFRLRRDEDEWWHPWKPVVGLAAAWLMVMALAEGVHLFQMSQKSQALDQEIETVFRDALPDAERMVNPRLRMEQRLNALRGSDVEGYFLPVMAAMGNGMASLDNGTLRGLSYRPGVLDVNLRVQSSAALDSFKDTVEEDEQFEATIQQANTRDDYVDGRLQVRLRGS